MRKRKIKLPIKLIAGIAIALLVLILAIVYVRAFFMTSEYFSIKEILTKDLNASAFSYLLGRNIFRLDLEKESSHILRFYPDSSRIIMVRVLPDRLFIGSVKRRPIALAKLRKYVAVDDSGTFFDIKSIQEEQQLPHILGLESKISNPLPGRRYNFKELALAIDIIQEVKKSQVLRDYKIRSVDVSSPDNASFILTVPFEQAESGQPAERPSGFEVKMGQDRIREKIDILSGIINQTKNDLSGIKYIDLRFKDAVIKFNDAKTKR